MNMINESSLTRILFFDLETSSEYKTLADLAKADPRKAELWEAKFKKMGEKDAKWKEMTSAESYVTWTPLSPEFGRIVCGSFGHVVVNKENGEFDGRMKSYWDTWANESSEERQVLIPIATMLDNINKSGMDFVLCGHNIKKFDIPFLVKRMIINKVPVPEILRTWGKKPWEIVHIDTGELWALGDWSGYISLDLLSCVLGVESPKTEMKGEYVGATFWIDQDYDKIMNYCEADVRAGMQICHTLSSSTIPLNF